jgi:hypothetical protein
MSKNQVDDAYTYFVPCLNVSLWHKVYLSITTGTCTHTHIFGKNKNTVISQGVQNTRTKVKPIITRRKFFPQKRSELLVIALRR